MIGTTVSHYRITEKLGGGGMGVVYQAEDLKLKRTVALKFLPPEFTGDADARERFMREAQAASALDHPGICTIYEIDETEDGRLFIAMAHYEGETLKKRFDRGPMPIDEAIPVAIQIAEGLQQAHQAGIVHRDIKPANVFLTTDLRAKILDFGLAKLVATGGEVSGETDMATEGPELTSPGSTPGTVGYMSPEQVQGKELDARSDIFSFGVLLYEMVTGRHAFSGRTTAMVFDAILHGTPTAPVRLNPEIDPELEHIINKALEKDRDLRYQSSADMTADLKRLQRDSDSRLSHRAVPTVDEAAVPSAEVPKPTAPPQEKATHAWKRLPVLAASALAVAAIAVAVFFGLRDTTPPGIGASGRPAVAVMPFTCSTATEDLRWLSQGVPDMLITGLGQTQGLDVVSTLRLHEILRKVAGGEVATVEAGQVLEVARRVGAGAVVVGSVFGSDSTIRIDARVEDVTSGRLLSAHHVQGPEVFDLVDELTEHIRADLGLSGVSMARSIAAVSSNSMQAQQLYAAGMEASSNLRYVEAIKLFRQAVEIDPSFAMAHFQIWMMGEYIGDRSLEEEHRARALQDLDRLPDRNRLYVQAVDAWGPAPERARDLLEERISRDHEENGAYISLQVLYKYQFRDNEKALETIERGVAALPTSGGLRNNLGYELLESGRYAEAVRELEKYAELEPEEPNPLDSLGEAYLIMGQPARAVEMYTRAIEMDASWYGSHQTRSWAYAALGRYDEALADLEKEAAALEREGAPITSNLFVRAFMLSRVGRHREAEQSISQGVELAKSLQTPGWQLHIQFLSALLALERGDASEVELSCFEAHEVMRERPEEFPDTDRSRFTVLSHALVGIAKMRAGDLSAPREHLESASDLLDVWPENWWRACLEGEIAIAEGDLGGAEEAFSAGEPELKMEFYLGFPPLVVFQNNLPFRDWRARIMKARGDLSGAIAEYRYLLTPDIRHKFTAVLEPRFVLELARLLDEAGDEAAARDEYSRFLELWKDADPDLPELAEAQTRLAQLKASLQ
jgi:tetratricopeptide (TPR) repeat protein